MYEAVVEVFQLCVTRGEVCGDACAEGVECFGVGGHVVEVGVGSGLVELEGWMGRDREGGKFERTSGVGLCGVGAGRL